MNPCTTRFLCWMRKNVLPVAVTAALAAFAASAMAVTPVTVNQSSEADFATAELNSTAITSDGQIRLGRALTFLMHSQEAPASISALAVADDVIYAASGSDNAIYKIEGGKSAKFANPGGTMIGSLLWTGQELLAGVNGDQGAGIYTIDKQGKGKLLWSNGDVKYIWAMVRDADGKVCAATGPKAQIFVIDPAGKGEKVYEAQADLAKNILCLVRAQDGTLYAGTDENGLVVAIDPRTKSGRVLLDASEKEISALALDAQGGVLAATSDSAKVGPDASDEGEGGDMIMPPMTMPGGAMPGLAPGGMTSTKPAAAASGPAKKAAAPVPTPRPTRSKVIRMPRMPGMMPGGEGEGNEGPGNAVYRIAPDGLVRTVFRKPVSIHSMLQAGNELILGTGNSGQVFTVNPQSGDSTMLADLEASQITCLAQGPDGTVLLGTANKGSVGCMAKGFAKSGTFVAKAIDATQIAKWGTLKIAAQAPAGGAVTVSTRTGNLAEPNDKTWSSWSPEAAAGDDFIQIASPAGRYMQYRLTFTSDGTATPQAQEVQLVYQVGNLAPVISAVTVASGGDSEEGGGAPRPMQMPMPMNMPGQRGGQAQPPQAATTPQNIRMVMVQASDPNNDQLIYTIEYRQVGTPNWIKIADKLDKPQYLWDTRTVGDGNYELRVTASDSPSNPPSIALSADKVSKAVTVDNTPPVVKELAAKADGAKIAVTGLAVDEGRIASIAYSLDSATEWTDVLPVDGICDSSRERFAFDAKDVKPGSHRLTVRVIDAYGNSGYANVAVTVAK